MLYLRKIQLYQEISELTVSNVNTFMKLSLEKQDREEPANFLEGFKPTA